MGSKHRGLARRRTKRRSKMNDEIPNATVAGIEETREADCRNADNHDLGHWTHFPIGDVPEVNGLWAQEVKEFVPTTGELLVVAEHWAALR
jgi:hypothetical protein